MARDFTPEERAGLVNMVIHGSGLLAVVIGTAMGQITGEDAAKAIADNAEKAVDSVQAFAKIIS